MSNEVHHIFEPMTGTWQYIVADPETKDAAIIDSVLDFDQTTMTISTKSADELLDFVQTQGYRIVAILETHAHADHLTASAYLQQELTKRLNQPKAQIGIGKRILQVQETFASKYGIDASELDSVFDKLYDDDECFQIGHLKTQVLHLPGHTPDHVGYVIGSNVFTGDSIFNPDVGSARCDFPGGSATQLYHSMMRLLALPPHYRLYTGHDYPPSGTRSEPLPYTTVEEQKVRNKHVGGGASEEQFVNWRAERDATLPEPKLIHHALQHNIRAGRLPPLGPQGLRLMHLPLKVPASFL